MCYLNMMAVSCKIKSVCTPASLTAQSTAHSAVAVGHPTGSSGILKSLIYHTHLSLHQHYMNSVRSDRRRLASLTYENHGQCHGRRGRPWAWTSCTAPCCAHSRHTHGGHRASCTPSGPHPQNTPHMAPHQGNGATGVSQNPCSSGP